VDGLIANAVIDALYAAAASGKRTSVVLPVGIEAGREGAPKSALGRRPSSGRMKRGCLLTPRCGVTLTSSFSIDSTST
jgi:hypothetical protein